MLTKKGENGKLNWLKVSFSVYLLCKLQNLRLMWFVRICEDLAKE